MATHASTFTGKTTANVSREILVAVDFGLWPTSESVNY